MRKPSRSLDPAAIPSHSIRERAARMSVDKVAAEVDPRVSAGEFVASLAKTNAGLGLAEAAAQMRESARRDRLSLALVGRSVVADGYCRIVSQLINAGLINAVACAGAAAMCDFELASYGQTDEESADARFGAWRESGEAFNQILNEGAARGFGIGEFLGRSLLSRAPRHVDLSILGLCANLRLPASVHPVFGADAVHRFAGADGAAIGRASQRDFLLLAGQLASLGDGGVVIDFWSDGLGGVFEQALAAAVQTTPMGGGRWTYVAFSHTATPQLPRACMDNADVHVVSGDTFFLSLLACAVLGPAAE